MSPTTSRSPTAPAASTRDGTVEIAERIKREYGLEVMAHLSCVGETRDGLREILDRFRGDRDRQRAGAARRPASRRDRLQAAGGRALSAAELTEFISDEPRLHARRRLLPRGPPRGRGSAGPIALPEDEGRRRRALPDHAALLRQPGLLRLRRRRARDRDRRADHPGRDPDHQLRAGGADLQALRRRRSRRTSSAAMERSAVTRMPNALLGVAYAARQCEELLAARRARMHFYRPQPGTRDSRRPRRTAGVTAVGAGGGGRVRGGSGLN